MKRILTIAVLMAAATVAFGQMDLILKVSIPANEVAATRAGADRIGTMTTNVSVIVTNGATVRTNVVRQVVVETDRARIKRLLLDAALQKANQLKAVGTASTITGE